MTMAVSVTRFPPLAPPLSLSPFFPQQNTKAGTCGTARPAATLTLTASCTTSGTTSASRSRPDEDPADGQCRGNRSAGRAARRQKTPPFGITSGFTPERKGGGKSTRQQCGVTLCLRETRAKKRNGGFLGDEQRLGSARTPAGCDAGSARNQRWVSEGTRANSRASWNGESPTLCVSDFGWCSVSFQYICCFSLLLERPQ